MGKKKNRDLDSTTPDPTRREDNDATRRDDPDKTRKKEKNDPTREPGHDITSIPPQPRSDDDRFGSLLNRTEV